MTKRRKLKKMRKDQAKELKTPRQGRLKYGGLIKSRGPKQCKVREAETRRRETRLEG